MKDVNLKKYLEKYKNTRVDFYRFPGNYGDSLIWHGTKNIMSDLNIEVRYIDVSFPVYSDVLFIDGGGNFNDYYSDVRNFLIKKGNMYREIVILPHTIFGKKQMDILNGLDSNITIFCRENISFNFIKGNLKKGKVYLCHDCAFYNRLFSKKKGTGVLEVFRSDAELVSKTMNSNHDISSTGYARSPLDQLMNTLDEYEEIHTDRLHIAIASVLLDKKVKLYPNSYYKNKAVYDYSLTKYSNIQFIESKHQDKHELNSVLISDIFTKFIEGKFSDLSKDLTDEVNLEDLIFLLMDANKKVWDCEDAARMSKLGPDHIVKAKKLSDENNQIRNDIIRKIDKNLMEILDVRSNFKAIFHSESPGMIIDRLSILFIKRTEIQKISQIIKEKDLKEEYLNKENFVVKQIKVLFDFLDVYFVNLRNKEVYFLVQDAVKIYNDTRIKKYIAKLRNNK